MGQKHQHTELECGIQNQRGAADGSVLPAPSPPAIRPLPSHRSQSGHFTSGGGGVVLPSSSVSSAKGAASSWIVARTLVNEDSGGGLTEVNCLADRVSATKNASQKQPVLSNKQPIAIAANNRKKRDNIVCQNTVSRLVSRLKIGAESFLERSAKEPGKE